jgi:hypothetical protein
MFIAISHIVFFRFCFHAIFFIWYNYNKNDLELKKWEKSDGLSNPTGPVHITDNYNVISD